MRNDVKLGFAIGGVLLAVLIVYVLVVPGGSDTGRQAGNPPAGAGSVSLEPIKPDRKADTAQATPPPAAPAEQFTPPASGTTASRTGDAAKSPAAAPELAVAGNVAPKVVDPQPPSNSRDIDWAKLLNETPALIGETPVATGNPASSVIPVSTAGQASAAPAAPEPVAQGSDAGNAGATPVIPEAPAPAAGETASASASGSAGTSAGGATAAEAPVPPVTPARTSEGANTSVAADPAPSAPSGNSANASSSAAAGAMAAGGRTHRVHDGETLSSISTAAYGSANYWPAIVRANPGINPNRLKVGTVINLPAEKDVKPGDAEVASERVGPSATVVGTTPAPTAASAAVTSSQRPRAAQQAATIDPSKQYRVATGDSLFAISLKLYGKSDRADKIYELNRQAIGEDRNRLKLGQVLQLPEPPTQTASSR